MFATGATLESVMRYGILITTLAVTALGFTYPAQASAPKLEGTFSDWATYSRVEGGDKICYVLAAPQKKAPSSVNHGDIYFMVSNWKSGQATEQPSLMTGYTLKDSSPPVAIVGASRTRMFVSANEAFIESASSERSLVNKMRAGANMRVQAVSSRGTSVSYEFSLKGVTAALKKAKSSCS
ncbi:invasion associated locus B family protein [Fretibacter rubidus]|uniref:invasion associated locus B family protein n=1 Tax=Fretibacter rubidus TaxID=570162 RepID=UPI00352AFE82